MEPGSKHYFEVKVLKGSYCKIGVCKYDALIDQAFSDNENGWALFNSEVRHGSNTKGDKINGASV